MSAIDENAVINDLMGSVFYGSQTNSTAVTGAESEAQSGASQERQLRPQSAESDDGRQSSEHSSTSGAHAQAESHDLPIVRYEFDEAFQDKIVALSLRDGRFMRQTHGLVRPEYFDSDINAMLSQAAEKYYEQYGQTFGDPSSMVQYIKTFMQEHRAPEAVRQQLPTHLKNIIRMPLTDSGYVADEVAKFARHRAIENAFLRSVNSLDRRDYGAIQKELENAFRVGLQADLSGSDYFETIEERTKDRVQKSLGKRDVMGVDTGIRALNKALYHNGWGRKELTVFMAGPKRGKSTALGFHCLKAAQLGYNVLYVTLEVSSRIIAERIDACLSEIPMADLVNRAVDVENEIRAKRPGVGTFKINEFPPGSLTPSQLRRLLDAYRAQGIVFDLVAVDYADIMSPDVYTKEPIENSKQVWLGLRRIAVEEECALLTATQTNRDGFKNDTARMEHVAEDINKIRIADLVISINRTDEERDRNEARLYFAASRNQAGDFSLTIKQDLETMTFIKGIVVGGT